MCQASSCEKGPFAFLEMSRGQTIFKLQEVFDVERTKHCRDNDNRSVYR